MKKLDKEKDNNYFLNIRRISRKPFIAGVSICMVFVFLMVSGCSSTPEKRSESQISMNSDDRTAEQWGVKVLSIRLSAEGYMLDFRYRVLDPEKAMPLFDRRNKPYLVDEATGAIFAVPEPPKVGALRTTRRPKPDRNYFIMFANPGKFIKPGNKVIVVIGDFRAEDLIVE